MADPAAPPAAARRLRPTNLLALLALPAFGPALAPFVAGWHWSLDLLACFPVQAMGALLLAATALAAARRFRPALGCAAGALAAAAAVVPGWLGGPAAAPHDGPVLRVLALNLQRGAEAHGAAACAVIRDHDPDVLFCSELTPGWLAALAPELQRFPHRHVAADPGFYGTGLFARLPLRAAANVPLGVDWAPAVRAVVATPGGEIGLLAVHTPRPGLGGARCHTRDAALAAIPSALADLPPARLVFGDCNATPWNHAFTAMLAAAALEPASTRAFRPTWPAQLPWPLRVPIDHVLLGGGLALVECEVGAPFGSDHLPLAATVRLAKH